MCSVIGAIVRGDGAQQFLKIWRNGAARGVDAHGVVVMPYEGGRSEFRSPGPSTFVSIDLPPAPFTAIASCRAEPTSEWVEKPTLHDIPPFTSPGWAVAHNGTIANDRKLAGRHSMKLATRIDSAVLPLLFDRHGPTWLDLARALDEVVGSYALVAAHQLYPERLVFACNYRPLYLCRHLPTGSVFVISDETFATGRAGRLTDWQVEPVPPYSVGKVTVSPEGVADVVVMRLAPPSNCRALVICSGGLDSTVAAAMLADSGHQVALLHFDYGCRATKAEARAIEAISKTTGWPAVTIPLGPLFTHVIGGSPLTQAGAAINHENGGEAGAEFAHEWVPARNLVMLSIATAYAEAHGFGTVALGINIEEAGAYPDNENEFVRRFDKLLPFAVGPGKRVDVVAPLAGMTKHQIVQQGALISAPMGDTWSCYEEGARHCGKCGPCFMRRRAFEMNGLADPVFDEKERNHG